MSERHEMAGLLEAGAAREECEESSVDARSSAADDALSRRCRGCGLGEDGSLAAVTPPCRAGGGPSSS